MQHDEDKDPERAERTVNRLSLKWTSPRIKVGVAQMPCGRDRDVLLLRSGGKSTARDSPRSLARGHEEEVMWIWGHLAKGPEGQRWCLMWNRKKTTDFAQTGGECRALESTSQHQTEQDCKCQPSQPGSLMLCQSIPFSSSPRYMGKTSQYN